MKARWGGNKNIWFITILFYYICLSSFSLKAKDLKASLAIIPLHAEIVNNQASGGFVEVVKLLDSVYPQGDMKLYLYPFARSIANVTHSKADFHLPLIRPNHEYHSYHGYIYVPEPICKVTFVLYTLASRTDLTPSSITQQTKVETMRGHKDLIDAPTKEVGSLSRAINKVLSGRSDGFIFEQEAVDAYLKANEITNIKRHLYAVYDSTIIVPNTIKGTQTAKVLSRLLKELKATGELQAVTDKIHKPYNNWQPTNKLESLTFKLN